MRPIILAACYLLLSSSHVFCDDSTPTPIADLIKGKLVDAKGHLLDDPASDATPIKYYAIYYSAQWCPPCHRFTPLLVSFYNDFKPTHPDFELIFVSEDNNEDSMLAYMKEMSMPWPAIKYRYLKSDKNGGFKGPGIEQFVGDGIPDLVLVDANGKVLADSFENGQYVGPQKVIEAIKSQVKP
jgi:nucleoredoxin